MGPGGVVGGKTEYKKSRETVPLRDWYRYRTLVPLCLNLIFRFFIVLIVLLFIF